MNNVVTIVVKSDSRDLTREDIDKVKNTLENTGAETSEHEWLSQGEAVDIPFKNLPNDIATQVLLERFKHRNADIFSQNIETREKKMLIADMDSTIIEVECIDEIAEILGLREKISGITKAAMNGELDFNIALLERVSMLQGVEESALKKVYEERITFTEGARELIATMRAHNKLAVLISGGFTYFTDKVKNELGFSHSFANKLEFKGSKLSGQVIGDIINANVKRETLISLRETHRLKKSEVLAVGDGANDIPMIAEAGFGVAFKAKQKTIKAANAFIHHTALNSLLFMQGYKRDEFKKG
ncbi:MAG: phosphoserine phosphatase SerB [Sphingomonadales bacterium]|jgi:phosphoserine phosphatase